MNTYEVQGSIALNFSVRVEAASEDEAEDKAKVYAEEGSVQYDCAVDEASITSITK